MSSRLQNYKKKGKILRVERFACIEIEEDSSSFCFYHSFLFVPSKNSFLFLTTIEMMFPQSFRLWDDGPFPISTATSLILPFSSSDVDFVLFEAISFLHCCSFFCIPEYQLFGALLLMNIK